MKMSLINISPKGVAWRTKRGGVIVRSKVDSPLPMNEKGEFVYSAQSSLLQAASYADPLVDLPEFFNALPKLERFFRELTRVEFTAKWAGITLINPTVAVQLTGYSRKLHLGEKNYLKDCVFRWGARNAITCDWPEVYSDAQFEEIQRFKP